MRKIQCHDTLCTSHLPSIGPKIGPTARHRDEGQRGDVLLAGDIAQDGRRPIGSSIEPPRPQTTRAATSCGSVWAPAQKSEPSTKMRIAAK